MGSLDEAPLSTDSGQMTKITRLDFHNQHLLKSEQFILALIPIQVSSLSGINLRQLYMGIAPLLVAPFIPIILLVPFPQLALWLPDLLYQGQL